MNYELKEMKDVEVLHVTPSRILAKGSRYGRNWLLRGLPPEKRNNTDAIRQLREEFDGRYSRLEPDLPITVGMEEIEGLGPCIVEEWREDSSDCFSQAEKSESDVSKHRLISRKVRILIIVLIALVGLSGAALYMRHLVASYETANADLESLREANRQGEERIHMLADSLDKALSDSHIPKEFARSAETKQLDKEERIARTLYQTKMEEFKRELARYDRQVMPQVIGNLPVFYDSICTLYRRILEMGNNVDPSGHLPQLPEDDRIRLTKQLYTGYMLSAGDYMRVWIPRACAASEKRKDESGDGKEN